MPYPGGFTLSFIPKKGVRHGKKTTITGLILVAIMAVIFGCNSDMGMADDEISIQVRPEASIKYDPSRMETLAYHEYSERNLCILYPYNAGNYLVEWNASGKKPGPNANYVFQLENAGSGYYYIKHVA